MCRRRSVFDAADGKSSGFEVHLRPLQVAKLRRSEPVPEGEQDHGRIPMRPSIALASLDELLDLALGEVFSCSDRSVLGPAWRDFPYFGGWGHHPEGWFCQ